MSAITPRVRTGVVFPQTEIGSDPALLRDFFVAAEALGFDHVLAFDHLLGVDPGHGGRRWTGYYDVSDTFFEPLTLFAHAAAVCNLELVTGVLVLPQRQTALVAKQSAVVDVLCGGRLRLGVGIGWNNLEYQALGRDFATRGDAIEEQISMLRELWTKPVVVGSGPHETLDGVGIRPQPVQRPIPVWIGSNGAPRALERVGRLADGFIPGPSVRPGVNLAEALDAIRRSRLAEGVREEIGVDGMFGLRGGDEDRMVGERDMWVSDGATHVTLFTMRNGLMGDQHINALTSAATALGLRSNEPERRSNHGAV